MRRLMEMRFSVNYALSQTKTKKSYKLWQIKKKKNERWDKEIRKIKTDRINNKFNKNEQKKWNHSHDPKTKQKRPLKIEGIEKQIMEWEILEKI